MRKECNAIAKKQSVRLIRINCGFRESDGAGRYDERQPVTFQWLDDFLGGENTRRTTCGGSGGRCRETSAGHAVVHLFINVNSAYSLINNWVLVLHHTSTAPTRIWRVVLTSTVRQ